VTTTTLAEVPVRTGKRQKVPTILQIEALECGAASLAMVLAGYGRWESLRTLRAACGVDRDGSTLSELAGAGVQFGLAPTVHRGTAGDLNGLPMPAIIWWDRKHFVVLEGAAKGSFYVNDPAFGRLTYSAKTFERLYSGAAVTFEPLPNFEKMGKSFNPLASLLAKLPGTWSGVVLAMSAGLLALLPGILLAPAGAVFIDQVLARGDKTFLPFVIGTMAVIGLLAAGLTYLQFSVLTRIQGKLASQSTVIFLAKLLRLPMLFFASRNIGDIVQRTWYNISVAQLLASQVASSLIAMIAVVAYSAVMFYYNWVLALIVLLLAAVNVAVLQATQSRKRVSYGLVMTNGAEFQGTTISTLQSIETIKSSGLEAEVFAKLANQQTRLVTSTGRTASLNAFMNAVPLLINLLTAVAIMIVGALAVIDGSLSLGGLIAFQALAIGVNGPISTLVFNSTAVQKIATNLERIDDALDNPIDGRYLVPPINAEARAASLRPLSGSVRFKDVEFSYAGGGDPVVRGLSFDLEPGSRVALVGTSGAGKTTIGNLAAGLLIPQSGSITYDGREINQIAPEVLGSQLAKVDQTIMLFKGTVRENVTFWDATISDDLVVEALRDAQILEMVMARPGGLDGEVVEGGANFSGGERQRLEIARALARSPNFLILDEATSALDTTAEFAVDCALRARGSSCLIIAHRLSTIRDADEILLLARGGAVAERGTHDELISLGGIYSELVDSAGSGGNVGT
jgi:NHLM bacteriocin system ABC transporter peptidase/ATP-binding protein